MSGSIPDDLTPVKVSGHRARRIGFPVRRVRDRWQAAIRRGPGENGDITQGNQLIAAAIQAWGEGAIKRILVDSGFIDGAWVSQLKADGIDTVIGVREDMDLYEDMLALSRWLDAK